MGFGAAIGGIVSGLASSAGGILGSLTQKGPNLAEYSSRLNKAANQYIQPFTDPNKWSLDIPGMAQQSIEFGLQNAPAINQFNMEQLQSLLGQAMPGYQQFFSGLQGTLGQMQNIWGQMQPNVTSMLRGQVPQDVQDQIRRNAAFTSLIGGSAGAGTGATGAITARDLGLTSLDLTQKGETMASSLLTGGGNILTGGQNLLGFARNYLMPQQVNPTSLLPLADLVSGSEWAKSALFQANEALYTAKANAAAAQVGAPSNQLAGITGAATGGIQSLFSGLGKLGVFGGGGGGGGGGGTVGSFTGGTSDFSSMFPAGSLSG